MAAQAAAKGGRFWGGDESGSESGGSDTEGAQQAPAPAPAQTAARVAQTSRWQVESESESEDEGRVVRSAKDKRWEMLLSIITQLRNRLRIGDWVRAQDDFDSLNKALERAHAVVKKEGIPRFYIRMLAELEDAVQAVSKPDTKKMSQ